MNRVNYESQNFHSIPSLPFSKAFPSEATPEKKLMINPNTYQHKPGHQNRSLSANGKFRIIFQVPKRQNKLSQYKKVNLSPINYQKYEDFKYLNEVSWFCNKENLPIRQKMSSNSNDFNRNGNSRIKVPKIEHIPTASPVKSLMDESSNLVTFRPEYSPSKKLFKFPRKVFTIDTKKKL
jgi:hypothetical protein